MDIRSRKITRSEEAEQALADIGAQPLAGSGFEDETPDPEFSDTAAAPAPPR